MATSYVPAGEEHAVEVLFPEPAGEALSGSLRCGHRRRRSALLRVGRLGFVVVVVVIFDHASVVDVGCRRSWLLLLLMSLLFYCCFVSCRMLLSSLLFVDHAALVDAGCCRSWLLLWLMSLLFFTRYDIVVDVVVVFVVDRDALRVQGV